MEEGKTINQFINYLILKYNIDTVSENKVHHNIRMKINRTIKKDKKLLETYNNLPKINIARTKAKVFPKDFYLEIEAKISDYLLSFNKLNVDEYMLMKQFIEKHSTNSLLFKVFIDDNIKKPNLEQINAHGTLDDDFKIKLFIEHMFYAQFDFNEFQYASDIEDYLNYMNKKQTHEINDIIQIITRLKNPHNYYFKKKK